MATINIFGVVGEDVRAADIIPKIQAEKGKTIEVGIMSIGGNVREGLAIYDALRTASANGQEVKTFALGITASIASVIFMAGDTREVSDNAEIMIHNSSVVMGGNKHDLQDAIETLDGIDSTMIDIYMSRTGLDAEKVAELLDKETFMSADEAVSQGFATDKANALALVAMINNKKKEPVKMAIEEDKQAGFLAHMAKWFKGEVKAEADDEEKKDDEAEKAESDDVEVDAEKAAFGDDEKKDDDEKAAADDSEKEEMKAKIESLEAQLADTKAKAEGDDEEKKKEEEAKASAILAGITAKKVTMVEASKLFLKPLSEVSAHLDGLLANATGRGKTEEPNADASSKLDQWKAMRKDNNHGAAQKFYTKHVNEIRSEMNKDK